jgi:hypothetical protein
MRNSKVTEQEVHDRTSLRQVPLCAAGILILKVLYQTKHGKLFRASDADIMGIEQSLFNTEKESEMWAE